MYLKSIEVQGFKSFANKILFQFHNGITAIVGPNGSGKSNVADAVRWVLGEQSAKSLRGVSMQDVIFSGTELRRPLGFASVSITMDNSDHQLPVAFDEVTVMRRVYRSGESEYRLNGTQVRLKDISELFYDTGIGKEGYSIIGQGQIDKILSDRPEERRELFDEAAGIVKFRRRRQAAQKKLEDGRQNLVRVSDILSELSRQLEPMKKQAESARVYLDKRETLKSLEVNLFLLQSAKVRDELASLEEKKETVSAQLLQTKQRYGQIRQEYEAAQQEMERMDALLQEKREQASGGRLHRQQSENQIRLLQEQIHTAEAGASHRRARIEAIVSQLADGEKQEQETAAILQKLRKEQQSAAENFAQENGNVQKAAQAIATTEQETGEAKNAIIALLNQRATVKARLQRYDTMLEQAQIRRAKLAQEILKLKSEESDQDELRRAMQEKYQKICEQIRLLTAQGEETGAKIQKIQDALSGQTRQMEEEQVGYHREASRLESLRNIAERYDGYGNSIRRVMERRSQEPGILGVVADIVRVEKEYETAVETALGASIQNIVTDTEETAKRQIEFLKINKFGRATFLPLSGISARGGFTTPQALKEPGVIGLASSLVSADQKYGKLVASLLGRTVVVDEIDHAIALARKYRHSLRIVTKDGELLSPGGSMTGGAFKNAGNLLGRRREIGEMTSLVKKRRDALDRLQSSIDRLRAERNGLRGELANIKEQLQQSYLEQNTAKLRLQELDEKTGATSGRYQRLRDENQEIEQQMAQIRESQEKERQELADSAKTEHTLEQQIAEKQEILKQQRAESEKLQKKAQETQVLLSRLEQQGQFTKQNLSRIRQEQTALRQEKEQYGEELRGAAAQAEEKERQISEIQAALARSEEAEQALQAEIGELSEKCGEKSALHRKFFEEHEDLSGQISLLDRELIRLNAQNEKLTGEREAQINYLWNEYALTPGAAQELRTDPEASGSVLHKKISALKEEIRGLGIVNVNAIEDYRELSERHSFLLAQRNDLNKAEADLRKVIAELDDGMRAQFQEQFARIKTEFDKAFRQLFGGGHGTLELVEDEDILTAGVRITAQPPGKKLQNMMQMSGGEKSLTAISLLFAIQNLKPSPFCLLDEIEAALDESNVERYANYLRRLTKNTQFIIITHRRGTMAAADRLYGVTMQEKGVSALVSVNLIEEELDD